MTRYNILKIGVFRSYQNTIAILQNISLWRRTWDMALCNISPSTHSDLSDCATEPPTAIYMTMQYLYASISICCMFLFPSDRCVDDRNQQCVCSSLTALWHLNLVNGTQPKAHFVPLQWVSDVLVLDNNGVLRYRCKHFRWF